MARAITDCVNHCRLQKVPSHSHLYPVYTIEQTSSKHQAGLMETPWLKCKPI